MYETALAELSRVDGPLNRRAADADEIAGAATVNAGGLKVSGFVYAWDIGVEFLGARQVRQAASGLGAPGRCRYVSFVGLMAPSVGICLASSATACR
jgi:hypothetical protein